MEGDSGGWAETPIPDIAGLDLLGGFSRACDLISSEYEWTDGQILDLPLRRIRQVCAAIAERRWATDLQARRLATVQLRTVCSWIAMTVPVDEGKENPLLAATSDITLGEGTGPAETPDVDNDDADDLPDGPPEYEADTEPEVGSYERMQALFPGSLMPPR